jgi:hypothetical protein
MSRVLSTLTVILLVCLVIAAIGGLVWANIRYVHAHPVEKEFLIPWLGARTFLTYGDSPYDEPATQRAQIVYYGRLASEGQDPLTLWLPFPLELFYFPFALIPDYVLARAIWMACLEISLMVFGYQCLMLTGWKPWRVFVPVIMLFPMLCLYGVFSLASGNATGFISLAVGGFLLALRDEQDELAGGLLVLLVGATRLTGVLAFFIFMWIIYRHRWRVLWGFLMSLAVLLAISFLFLPGWFLPFLRGLLSHFTYNQDLSSIRFFAAWSPVVGLRLGWVLAGSLLLVVIFGWINSLKKDFRTLLWIVSLSLAVVPLLGIPMASGEFPFLFLPLILILSVMADRRPWLKRWGIPGIMVVFALAGLWVWPLDQARVSFHEALLEVLLLLVPTLLVIGLIWTRWWFLHIVPTGLETPLLRRGG